MAENLVTGPVRVSGLRELDRALGRVAGRLRSELSAELRVLAAHVRDTAVVKASEQGFSAPGESGRGRGDLMRKLSYSVRGGMAFITEGAYRSTGKNAPYNYPAVYEFSKRFARPFMLPALEEDRPLVEAGLADMVGRLVSEEGLGHGGLL